MKKLNLFKLIFIIAILSVNLYSQEDAVKGEKNEEIPLFGLKVIHKSGTFFTSKLTEITSVHRILPDETTKDYSREIVYYFTSKIPSSPENDFQSLTISVDSIQYKFKDGETVLEFGSADMKGNAIKFKDLNCKTVPIGRVFEMVYSPYGEVASIQGADIDETITYVNEKGKDYLSDIDMYLWLNGLSKEHLEYLADMKKIILPKEKIAKDSLWYSPVSMELNGYSIIDTLALKIVNYNAGVYSIEGESLSMKPLHKESFTYNVSGLVDVTGVSGEGKLKMQLKGTGIVQNLDMNYKINAKIKVLDQNMIEQIQSNIKWELLNMYKL